MRFTPIEKPGSLLLRFAYAQSRRAFGKVITPLKTIYARVPRSLWLMRAIHQFHDAPGKLDPDIKTLVMHLGAVINHCGFCIDISRARTERDARLFEKLERLPQYADSNKFTPREKAALVFADELIRDRRVSDETFSVLSAHFTEEEIVELSFYCAIENFYNLLNIAAGIESDGLCTIDRKGSTSRAVA